MEEYFMFVMLLKYVKPLEEVDKFLEAHKEFLNKYLVSGNIVCCGRQNPRTGGVIVCNAKDRTEAEKISAEDPFLAEGVAEYTIIEFDVTKMAAGFEPFIRIP